MKLNNSTVAKFATVQTEVKLEQNSVVAKNATTTSDGKTYQVEYFN